MALPLQRGAATISSSGTVAPARNERIRSAHSFAAGDSDSITGADGSCAISETRTDAIRAARAATNRCSAIGTGECATDNSPSTASPDRSHALSAPAHHHTAGGDGHSASSYAATERVTGGSRDVGGRSPAGSRSAASLGLLQRACRRHLRAADPRSHPPLPTEHPVRRDWLPHGGPGQPLGYASMKRLRGYSRAEVPTAGGGSVQNPAPGNCCHCASGCFACLVSQAVPIE